MEKTSAKIIKTACVYAGLVFGAGFASGREHLTFFLRHGPLGILGLIFSAALISFCGWAVMGICVKENIGSYKEFMKLVFGKKLGGILDIITGVFIFVIFSAMLAGTGALGGQALGLPFSAGVFAAAILVFIVLLFDLRGMVEINTIVTPILVVGTLIVGLYSIFSATQPAAAFGGIIDSWPTSALVYASYNMLPAAAVLSSMPALVTNKSIARWGGLLGGIFLGVIGIVMSLALFTNLAFVRELELPMLALALELGHIMGYLYMFLLFLAILTTAVTNGFSLTAWLSSRINLSPLSLKILITLAAIAAAHAGFSNIVSKAYAFFGFLGLYVMFATLIYFIRNHNKSSINKH